MLKLKKEYDPERCNPKVFAKGRSIGVVDITSEEANAWCKEMAEETGDLYDWHYFGGRVHLLWLPRSRFYRTVRTSYFWYAVAMFFAVLAIQITIAPAIIKMFCN